MKKETEWVGEAFLGEKDSGFHAEVFFLETEDSQIVAHAFIDAPKRGDEILGWVIDQIQGKADELGQPIVHEGQPSNKGAVRLFKRTQGYEKKRSLTGPRFLRIFEPVRK